MIAGLVGSLIFIYIAGHATHSTWTYYTMEKFNWDVAMVGYSLGFVGLTVAIVQGGLTRIVIPKIGPKKSVFVGLSLYTVGFLLFAFANHGWMMFAFIIPYALGGLAGPSLQGIISNQVTADEQGKLQGALTSLTSATAIIGPPLMTNLFAFFTAADTVIYFPGCPFSTRRILRLCKHDIIRQVLD